MLSGMACVGMGTHLKEDQADLVIPCVGGFDPAFIKGFRRGDSAPVASTSGRAHLQASTALWCAAHSQI